MTVLAWHLVTKQQDYAFARPGLVAHKRRKLELTAGAPSRRGNDRTPGAAYNDKQRRRAESEVVEQAEHAYQVFVAHWQTRQPRRDHSVTESAPGSRPRPAGGLPAGLDPGCGPRLSARTGSGRS